MNENARKWVEALRSDEYEQGQVHLRTVTDDYCCLGIACEKAVEAGVIPAPTKTEIAYRYGSCGEGAVLPREVQEWLGLTTERGGTDRGYSLTTLNDRATPFTEIANLIESEPEGLFA